MLILDEKKCSGEWPGLLLFCVLGPMLSLSLLRVVSGFRRVKGGWLNPRGSFPVRQQVHWGWRLNGTAGGTFQTEENPMQRQSREAHGIWNRTAIVVRAQGAERWWLSQKQFTRPPKDTTTWPVDPRTRGESPTLDINCPLLHPDTSSSPTFPALPKIPIFFCYWFILIIKVLGGN